MIDSTVSPEGDENPTIYFPRSTDDCFQDPKVTLKGVA